MDRQHSPDCFLDFLWNQGKKGVLSLKWFLESLEIPGLVGCYLLAYQNLVEEVYYTLENIQNILCTASGLIPLRENLSLSV